MIPAYRHSFAKLWLHKTGNKILINNKNFFDINLHVVKNHFKIKPLHTYICTGEDLIDDDGEEIVILPYTDLKQQFGYAVYRILANSKTRWRKGQKYILVLNKIEAGVPNEVLEKTFSNRGLKIEWNKKEEWVRGVGQDFGDVDGQCGVGDITPKLYYNENKKPHKFETLDIIENIEEVTENLVDSWDGKRLDVNKKIMIKKMIPVMITDAGELLCIPYDKDYVPKIVGVGETGSGKTWTLNSIMGRVVYIFRDRAGILNDSLDQLHDLMLPMNEKGMIYELNRIGNEPRRLPVINLYMSGPNVDIRYAEEQVGYRLVVSLYSFLRNWDSFTKGIKKWDIGGPGKYLSKTLAMKLSKCKNRQEFADEVYTHFKMTKGVPNKKTGEMELETGIKNMVDKWIGAIDFIFADQFTDNLFQDEESTASRWKLITAEGEEYEDHPFIIALYAGLFPIVNNSLVKTRPIAKKQLAWLINHIVDWQMAMKDKKKRIWIGIDELKDLLGRKGDDVYSALDYLFSQGRFPMIGFVGNLQEYTKMSKSMQNNTSHIVVFDLPSKLERKAITENYGCKERMEEISKLKEHECLFITKKKMVLFDKNGKEKVKKAGIGGLWKGKILPPITVHKKPSDK